MFSLFSNTGNDSPRQKTEKELAHEFISILQRHHRNIQRSTGGPEAAAAAAAVGDDDDLLAGINMTERKILSGVTYQNWMAGMAAGALTFGVLMGISLRSAAAAQRYKLPRRASAAVRDIDHIATTTSHRGGGGGSGSNNRAKVVKTISVGKHKRPHSGRRPSDNNHEKMLESSVVRQPSEAMDPTSLRSEIMSEVQFMVYGATSLVVTILTSWYFADRSEFYRQVGRLPLAAGKSRLSQEACPDIVQHYRELMTLGSSGSSSSRSSTPTGEQSAEVLQSLRNPETVELDSMLQLVLNCQQRSAFVNDRRHSLDQLPPKGLIDVPESGVPFNYLGIPVGSTWDKPGNPNDFEADIVEDVEEEYDWLRKLVVDR